jgi:hypothetical protein
MADALQEVDLRMLDFERMRQERDEARERERVAIMSWDEERQRALREGERVLEARRERDEAREKCAALGKAIRYSPEATTLLGKFLQTTKERDETKLALCSLAKQFESDIQKANAMAEKAKALIDRWDRPTWKDTSPTAGFISALGNAVEAYEKTPK